MKKTKDCLSPEEIEAATRKVVPAYYICYDVAGNITSATNMLPTEGSYLQVSYSIFEKFATGAELFTNWVVSKTGNSSNNDGVDVVPKAQQSITFRNNMFEWVKEEPDSNTEVTIHWDQHNKKWLMYVSPEAKNKIYNAGIGSKTLVFYVTAESRFDQLIRIIEININELLTGHVEIPFVYDIERNIDNINLATKSVFKTYGLKIWREIKE